MRVSILSLIGALAAGLVIVPFESVWPNSNPHRVELIGRINAVRVAQGLDSLEVDPIRCSSIENRMEKLVKSSGVTEVELNWAHEFDRCVADWEKQGFLATGYSESSVLQKLEEMPGFTEAVLRPDASHIALGIRRNPSGNLLCVVYIIRRLVFLNPFEASVAFDGPTYFTISGRSRYKFLRVRFYKGAEPPTLYEGQEDYSVDLEADESGEFRVTLPISRFGLGEYQIVAYVSGERDGEYVPAVHTSYEVWEYGSRRLNRAERRGH